MSTPLAGSHTILPQSLGAISVSVTGWLFLAGGCVFLSTLSVGTWAMCCWWLAGRHYLSPVCFTAAGRLPRMSFDLSLSEEAISPIVRCPVGWLASVSPQYFSFVASYSLFILGATLWGSRILFCAANVSRCILYVSSWYISSIDFVLAHPSGFPHRATLRIDRKLFWVLMDWGIGLTLKGVWSEYEEDFFLSGLMLMNLNG